jgi:hypothetical protein
MKRFLVILLLIAVSHAQELKRPTADTATGSATILGCQGAASGGGAMGLAYDAAGLSTNSSLGVTAVYKAQRARVRNFNTWQTPGGSYSSLILSVNASSTGWISGSLGTGGTGKACIAYSTNAGATWVSIACDTDGSGWAQQTFSFTLSPTQDFTKLQVGACVSGTAVDTSGDVGGDQISIYDIWTLGTTAGAAVGTGSSSGSPHRGVVVVN